VVLGHTGVGKTSIVNFYVRGFTGATTATIGAAFMKKDVVIDNWTLVLQIWDTAGQERFRSMAPMYYRGAHAAILCYDVTQPSSLEKVEGWVEELQQHANEDIILVMAGNKCDLPRSEDEGVPFHKAQAYAKSINAAIFETSAKSGQGVQDLFNYVATHLLNAEKAKQQARQKQQQQRKERGGRAVNLDSNKGGGGGCC